MKCEYDSAGDEVRKIIANAKPEFAFDAWRDSI